MKSKLERQAHELNEKMTLLEINKYPPFIYKMMTTEVYNIIKKYKGKDFDELMNRYLMLNGEKATNEKEECFGI